MAVVMVSLAVTAATTAAITTAVIGSSGSCFCPASAAATTAATMAVDATTVVANEFYQITSSDRLLTGACFCDQTVIVSAIVS